MQTLLESMPESNSLKFARAMLAVVHPLIIRGILESDPDYSDSRDHHETADIVIVEQTKTCRFRYADEHSPSHASRTLNTTKIDGKSVTGTIDVVVWAKLALPWWIALLHDLGKHYDR